MEFSSSPAYTMPSSTSHTLLRSTPCLLKLYNDINHNNVIMMHSGHPLITNEYELLYDWFIIMYIDHQKTRAGATEATYLKFEKKTLIYCAGPYIDKLSCWGCLGATANFNSSRLTLSAFGSHYGKTLVDCSHCSLCNA